MSWHGRVAGGLCGSRTAAEHWCLVHREPVDSRQLETGDHGHTANLTIDSHIDTIDEKLAEPWVALAREEGRGSCPLPSALPLAATHVPRYQRHVPCCHKPCPLCSWLCPLAAPHCKNLGSAHVLNSSDSNMTRLRNPQRHFVFHIFYTGINFRLPWSTLKMTGKGFVLFKINSSPSAFYIIKPLASWLVFKVSNYPLKIVEKCKPERLFMLPIDDVIQWRKQTSSLFVFLEWR